MFRQWSSAMVLGLAVMLLVSVSACRNAEKTELQTEAPSPEAVTEQPTTTGTISRLVLSDEEWKQRLTPEQYRIVRQKGTERAFTGKYNDHKEDGVYRCIGCGTELFSSEQKYDSRSGWPSFWAPSVAEHVAEETDTSLGMTRVEVLCSVCDAHLGHVFEDGPQPTGLRYCINSLALDFAATEP